MKNLLTCMTLTIALAMTQTATAAMWTFTGGVTAAQETAHPVTLPDPYFGAGAVAATYDDVTGEFRYAVVFSTLTGAPIAAHFHVAPPGVDGAVVLDIGVPTGFILSPPMFPTTTGDYIGSATIDLSGYPDLFDGLGVGDASDLYVNIHTDLNPLGEIRGQLIVASSTAVPLPAAVWPLGTGLLALFGAVRRKR